MASKESTGPQATAKGGGASDNKYDRQLRLWQGHGQLALLNARVCTLGSGPIATEFLKNIVLPGVGKSGATDNKGNKIDGKIVIVDDAVCTKRDNGNNFFVPPGSIGKCRAEVVAGTLQELNPDDTCVVFKKMSAEAAVAQDGFFDSFTLVVATQLAPQTNLKLEAICRAKSIPLIVGRINGLIGLIRNSFAEHTIIESKPSNYTQRLHARKPWPELKALAAKAAARVGEQDSQGDTVKAFGEIPWLLLLINELVIAKKNGYDENELDDYSKRIQFMKSIEQKATDFIDPINEKNFEDGKKAGMDEDALNKSYIPSPPNNYVEAKIPFNLGQLQEFSLPRFHQHPEFYDVWEDARVTDAKAPSLPETPQGYFWMLARTLKRFVDKNERFPVRKEMPDMECLNSLFVELQNCFKAKALADMQEFKAMCAEEFKDSMPGDDLIALFCANSCFIELSSNPSMATEYSRKMDEDTLADVTDMDLWEYTKKWVGDDEVKVPMAQPRPHPFKMYLLMRVADSFYNEHGYYPGWTDATYKKDLTLVKPHVKKTLAAVGIEDEKFLDEKYEMEIVRYGAGEIHVTAAFVGGFLAQEAIKLITHQFQPMCHTFIYNGLNGTARSMKFNFE